MPQGQLHEEIAPTPLTSQHISRHDEVLQNYVPECKMRKSKTNQAVEGICIILPIF